MPTMWVYYIYSTCLHNIAMHIHAYIYIYIYIYTYGTYIYIWDTYAPSHNSLAVREAGLVAKRAEDSKKQKYGEICSAYAFVPIAVETSGVFGDEAKAFFRRLGFLSRSKTHDPLSHQKIVQCISVSIQQFNSLRMLGSSTIQTFFL